MRSSTITKEQTVVQRQSKCTNRNCKNNAVSLFLLKRGEKTAHLIDLEEVNFIPFHAILYCKTHSNSANVPLGWELKREVREFAEFEIEKEKNAARQVLAKTTKSHPVYSKKRFADDEITKLISLRKVRQTPKIPESRIGTKIGNLVAVRANGDK